MSTAYESLVGWRYLLRRDRKPRPLVTGLALIVVGVGLVGWAAYSLGTRGQSIQLVGMVPSMERNLLYGGVGCCVLGGSVALFGALYYRMTIFSAFSTFMVTIGVAEVILVLGVMNGLHSDLRNNIISSDAHVQIHPKRASNWLHDYKEVADLARSTTGVLGATPFLKTEVIIAGPSNSRPAVLMGIDTQTVHQANQLPEQIEFGCLAVLDDSNAKCRHWLLQQSKALSTATPKKKQAKPGVRENGEPKAARDEFDLPDPKSHAQADLPALLLGKELAEQIIALRGRPINVISPLGDLGPSGPIPRSRPFSLAGSFSTKMLRTDETLAYASLSAVQRFMELPDVANGIQIRVESLDAARGVRDRLRKKLPAQYTATDWQDRNQNLFAALKIERIVMFLVLSINILLAAFSITGTLVMTILERKREIAILMAMGSTQRSILRLFLSQGALTGVLGSAIGTTIGVGLGLVLAKLGLPLNTDVYYIDAIPVDIRPGNVATIIGVAVLVSMVSTIYPARFASRVNPVEGLNAE